MTEKGTFCPKCGKFGAAVEVVAVNDEVNQIVTKCDKCGTEFEWAKFRPDHMAEDLKLRRCPVCGAGDPQVKEAQGDGVIACRWQCSECQFQVTIARKV
ncbi:MAG: hypothetical protein GF403_06435 [Candidatus Coatesbacteria bacterium]|nr:hypothetical protein [Candidatus Coatesbacteria bacterium]